MKIHLFAFSFLLASFLACQQNPEAALTVAASAGAQSGERAPATEGILFQSTDYGLNWKDITSGLPAEVSPMNIGTSNQGEIFMGTNAGLYRMGSGPDMTTWIKELFVEYPVTGIFPGQAGSYAISQWNGLFQHLPGSSLWTPLTTQLDDKMLNTILETSEGTLLAGCESGIYRSDNRGNTWQRTSDVKRIWALTESDGVLIASGGNGIQRSADGGAHWEQVEDIHGSILLTRRFDKGFLVVVQNSLETAGDEVFVSEDGAHWQHLWETRPSNLHHINDLEIAGQFLFISSAKGIFRSSDNGKSWEMLRAAPPGENNFMRLVVVRNLIFLLQFQGGGC